MDGDQFDQIARESVVGPRRHVLAWIAGTFLAATPDWSHAKRNRKKHRQNQRRKARQKHIAPDPGNKAAAGTCKTSGSACAADTDCCQSLCEKSGACTRKKKQGKKRKVVLTGACRCAEMPCVPDNASACAARQCGDATTNCDTTISCGTCPASTTCQNGTCVSTDSLPAQPTGLQAIALDPTRIRLTWNDVSGESGYRIHDGASLVATVSSNTTSYTVTGLAPNTYKCHRIQAFNVTGDSSWTDWSCTSTQSTCVPNCGGKVCGPDGCGGACGSCGSGSTCESGSCVSEPDCDREGQYCSGSGNQGSCCSGLICEYDGQSAQCRNCRPFGQSCSAGDTCCSSGTCCQGRCVSSCCERRHSPMTGDCRCIDKGPVTLSLQPSSISVAQNSTFDLTVRLEMVPNSHLPTGVSVGLTFSRDVLEPISFQVPSSLNDVLWQRLDPGHVSVTTTAGFSSINVLRNSANVIVFRFRAIGNRGASSVISFVSNQAVVVSMSECDQAAENILDASFGASVTIS